MSKPNASSAGSHKVRFVAGLAAAVLGATALTIATPLPAAADDRGRWEQSGGRDGNRNGKGRPQGQGRRQEQWHGAKGRGGGGSWGGWNGGGGHDHDDRHHGGNSYHYSHGGPKWKYPRYAYYPQPVYVPRPVYVPQPVYVPTPAYAYAPAYLCNPCAHAFATYDELYQHVAYAHAVAAYDVPNVVVQVGVNWVFGF